MSFAFAQGFATSAALIVAIGAQNAFVLRQGLKREHVAAVVAVCALSDLLLISLGVAGLGALVQREPAWVALARYGGAAFLIVYGALAARRALAGEAMATAAGGGPTSLRKAVLACLAFTYLNPHCWLDTVVLMGSISTQQPLAARPWFGAGAASASLVWFVSLGYGARLLDGVFARPAAWRVLDAAIALMMWGIAASLLAASFTSA